MKNIELEEYLFQSSLRTYATERGANGLRELFVFAACGSNRLPFGVVPLFIRRAVL